jgi:hypothetical protein
MKFYTVLWVLCMHWNTFQNIIAYKIMFKPNLVHLNYMAAENLNILMNSLRPCIQLMFATTYNLLILRRALLCALSGQGMPAGV